MKTIVVTMLVGAGILLVPALQASAAPANGAAIANIEQQVAPVINVATKKKKKKNNTGPCPADQKRDRFGYCVPNANL
jgi:hypothetical protein